MKKLFILTVVLSVQTFMYAQKNDYHDRVMAMKTAFITQELNLSAAEAEKFWPLYNAFENNIYRPSRHQLREIRKTVRENAQNFSEQEAKNYLEKMFQLEETILTERKKMMLALAEVVSPKKILQLQKVEYDFDRKMLEEYRKRNRKD
ncbi:MAG: hypothetical protein RQ735_11305 [Flavobacteriaceae bacterium]|nr:hypothetical protein [Flavobacteriaceae bacterium]